nr:hypothetical protein [Tanacetum cinerariifolium]
EYYACATGEAAPKPKASARRKRSYSDTSITHPTATPTPITTVAAALRLTAAAKGKQPAKAKSPYDPSEKFHGTLPMMKMLMLKIRTEMTMKAIRMMKVMMEKRMMMMMTKMMLKEMTMMMAMMMSKRLLIDKPEDTESGGGNAEETESDEESTEEETREEEEESFDPIPKTPEDSEDDGKGEEDQGLRGRGLQVSQDIEDSHVTLTLVHPDGQQESSSMSSFVTSMLNPISDTDVESIFTTASSSVAPLPTHIPTMTLSIITTITIASHPSIPLTPIPSEVLQNLPTFNSVFRFNERLKSLEASFSEYRQTNPFAEDVSNISGIVHQYMNQQMHEAVRVAVQI